MNDIDIYFIIKINKIILKSFYFLYLICQVCYGHNSLNQPARRPGGEFFANFARTPSDGRPGTDDHRPADGIFFLKIGGRSSGNRWVIIRSLPGRRAENIPRFRQVLATSTGDRREIVSASPGHRRGFTSRSISPQIAERCLNSSGARAGYKSVGRRSVL